MKIHFSAPNLTVCVDDQQGNRVVNVHCTDYVVDFDIAALIKECGSLAELVQVVQNKLVAAALI